MKYLIFVLICTLFSDYKNIPKSNSSSENEFNISIPTAANSWVMHNNLYISSDIISSDGIRNWENPEYTIRTFFYVGKTGEISLGIKAKVKTGVTKLKVSFLNETREIVLNEGAFDNIYIGDFQVKNTGYHYVDITGVEKVGSEFADVNDILLGKVNADAIKYIKNDFYWGRRGPSVHLFYDTPEGVNNVEWFYSELLVPPNQDVIGSYFVANGFSDGYFGIQVNSSTERRILFSVWSPYNTDNPSVVPQDYKVIVLRKGKDVITQEFGNEGTGGQSFKRFKWKSGVRYGFLVGVKPTGDGSTDYIAYFYDPDINKWNLIAQFRRPKTNTFLTGLYSFLENFKPEQGVFGRKALYGNQWVYDSNGWHEVYKVTFSADNTARKENRLDYSGGIENNDFYLRNCGFTNDLTLIDSGFERNKLYKEPSINFELLD